jgi:hypothetical protein
MDIIKMLVMWIYRIEYIELIKDSQENFFNYLDQFMVTIRALMLTISSLIILVTTFFLKS